MHLMPQLCRAMVRRERNYLTRGDLTLPQLWALEIMHERPTCSMHEVVTALQLKPSTASMFMDRLVEIGVARRQRDREDRRAVRVTLTPKGRRILQQIEKQRRKGMLALYKPLTSGERGAYLILLEKLVRELSGTTHNARQK